MTITVRDYQQRLADLGFDPGAVDGIRGKKTIAAVEKFQASRGLTVDGIVGRQTTDTLFATVSAHTDAPPDVFPWLTEGLRVMGWHEVHDNAKLRAWLASDGHTLGDPRKLPWCFAGDVEILTEDGWQRFDRLSAGRVWQVDEAGRASLTNYRPVTKIYEGDAYDVDGPTFQGVCDSEHRWWGSWGRRTRQQVHSPDRKGTLAELQSPGLRIPTIETASAGVDMNDDAIALLAAFIAEGFVHHKRLEFAVSKAREIAALSAMQPSHTYRQKRAYGPLTVTPLTVFAFNLPDWLDSVFVSYKHLSRAFINGMSKAQCRHFLHSYAQFDGNCRSDGRITLYTSDAQIRDDLIQIAALAGYWPRVEKGGRSKLTRKQSWRIGFVNKENIRKRIRREDVSVVPFNGRMYCVTVPAGRIVVRGRNMTPCVTGNCGDFVETCILRTLPDESVPNNPYWARNWTSWGVACEPQPGAVLVFSRGANSGHVGFYVGETANHFVVLGGNQSNRVSKAKIAKNRLIARRWPATFLKPRGERLHVSAEDIATTTNEA